MDRIVHSTIHKVTKKKTREEHKSILAHNKKHDAENCRRKNKTWYGRHKEPLPITGVMMMIAVKYVRKLLHPRIFTYQMKKKPVCYVFEKRPEQHTANKRENNSCKAE